MTSTLFSKTIKLVLFCLILKLFTYSKIGSNTLCVHSTFNVDAFITIFLAIYVKIKQIITITITDSKLTPSNQDTLKIIKKAV